MAAQSVTCLAKMYLALKPLVLFDITGLRAESGDPSVRVIVGVIVGAEVSAVDSAVTDTSVGLSDHSLSGILTLFLYNFLYKNCTIKMLTITNLAPNICRFPKMSRYAEKLG